MTWRAKIAGFFTEKETSECFVEAKKQLSRLKDNINYVNIKMDDEISPLVFVKNKWQAIPHNIGKNCFYMGLDSSLNYNLVLNDMGPGGTMYEHSHTLNYEEILVLEGSIKVNIDGDVYDLGIDQRMTFGLDSKHSISSKEGARFLIAYSPQKENAVVYNENVLIANNFERKI